MVNLENVVEKTKVGVKNWAIDTSAKAAVYTLPMAAMEAYNDLNTEQILNARVAAIIVDGGVARIYTKTADYLFDKLNVDPKKGGVKAWALETVAMIGVYTPVYATILKVNGVSDEKILTALGMAAGIAILLARPFRKYALIPWRNFWKKKGEHS